MRELFKRNLVAGTILLSDASSTDTILNIANTLRFEKGDEIIVMDDTCVWNEDANQRVGLEFHTVEEVTDVSHLRLKLPLQKSFLLSDNGRIQKAIRNVPLYPKDIYFGDREAITWDYVAICVEPQAQLTEWLALGGLLSNEYRMSLMVYVRMAGSGEMEEYAQRTCIAYADAIENLLNGNIHLDLTVDEIPILVDVLPGDTSVWIDADQAWNWGVDFCTQYEVQDNYKQEWDLAIIPEHYNSETSSSSSSDSYRYSPQMSSSRTSDSSSFSSPSSYSSSLFSSSSLSSLSSTSSSLHSSTSSSSSRSSLHDLPMVQIFLNRPLEMHYRVKDKAVLRRKNRYMYDSRVTEIEYGLVQRKSVLLKAAKLSWFGKETQVFQFPQVGKGGSAY